MFMVVSYSTWNLLLQVAVLSICKEFLSDLWQRVLVDGATGEWIPIVSILPQVSVLSPLLLIIYTSEMFDLVEYRPYACTDDSTLLAVVRKPEDRPAVATSLNRDFYRIQNWWNHCCVILNPNKTKALVVSRSRTVNTPPWWHGLIWAFYPS